jgi:hypothetical protein
VDVSIHIFFASALVRCEWSASRPGRFTPGVGAAGTQCIGDWVGPRAGLDDVEKRKFLTLPVLELRPLGRPARSQSLYRLSYPGSFDYYCGFLLTAIITQFNIIFLLSRCLTAPMCYLNIYSLKSIHDVCSYGGVTLQLLL